MNSCIEVLAKTLIDKESLKRLKKDILRFPGWLLTQVGVFFVRLFTPVNDDRIIFITFRGEYDCNAKWIAEELKNRNAPYEVVWTLRKNIYAEDIPAQFIITRRGTLDFYRYLASSKIIVDNGISTSSLYYKKKKNQILIETWHGSLGIKMFSKETNKDKRWCRKAEKEGRMTDYCLSNSTFEDKVFTDTFWSRSKILQLGHARNDILCLKEPQEIQPIREKVFSYFELAKIIEQLKSERNTELNVWLQEKAGASLPLASHLGVANPFDEVDFKNKESLEAFLENEYRKCEDLRICLYAPTFRDDGDMRPYQIDYEQLQQALHERFGGSWAIMTRFHFRLKSKLKNYVYPSGVINASNYPDIQELLACVDVGITDYSSWICDFMLTRRPGFLFAPDMTEYELTNREFFYPLDSMPFPLALNNEQLVQNILSFDEDCFLKECDEFLADKGCIDDGHASERIVDVIEKLFKGEMV